MRPMHVADGGGDLNRCFLDSNVLLYLLSADTAKADCAERLLKCYTPPVISVQVLNEVTHVCRRKLGMTWDEIDLFQEPVRRVCNVVPLTCDTHDSARWLAARYQLSFYDACIVAAAIGASCRTLFSEDMHDGLLLGGQLTIRNPFIQNSL